jgi:hypothetical protein
LRKNKLQDHRCPCQRLPGGACTHWRAPPLHGALQWPEPLETALESLVKTREPVAGASRSMVVFTLEQQANNDGRQGPRQRIGRQHREHHREPERSEEEFCRPFQEYDRGEYAADRQRRNHGRDGDAGEPCSVAAARLMPSPRKRWVFSIVTVESSTRMTTASASPPGVMVLSVSPRKCRTMIDARIDSGIEISTMTVGLFYFWPVTID